MSLSPATVQQTLARLAALPWPKYWSAAEHARMRDDYLGWCHRYRLAPPAPERELAAFEAAHRVTLPAEYRAFLGEIGNGGAGPGRGLYPLGTFAERPLRASTLRALSKPFDAGDAENWEPGQRREVMKGAMIIGVEADGVATWVWLVVTGEEAGQLWRDLRADGGAPEAIDDADGDPMTFGRWYETWLATCIAKWPPP
jgi:hypothetical protein